jgi:hypothetical protein
MRASRSVGHLLGAALACVLVVWADAAGQSAQSARDVVATGVPRPLELLVDGQSLVVLSPGAQGGVAAEIYRVPLQTADPPIDLGRQPRVRLPLADASATILGSLALDARSGDLLLGEENGTRIWRLSTNGLLTLYATGLRRLAGGSVLAFDGRGRLVLVDYADPFLSESEERPPPGLEQFRDEDYRGPLVYRLAFDDSIRLPRRFGYLAPLFPRGWGARARGVVLPYFTAVVPLANDDLVLLTSSGDLYRLRRDGTLALFTQLPRGQYNRTHMVAAPDGTVFVSGGFQVTSIFRVSSSGAVTTLAQWMADPEGIALDGRGYLYVAESSLHRIVRLPVPPGDARACRAC